MASKVVVCRCEDVTLHDLEHSVARGYRDIEEVKRYTGFGTGPCQGKECIVALARLLVTRGVLVAADAQPFTARPPAEPVTLATLAALSEERKP